MAIAPLILLLFVLAILVYRKRKTVLTNAGTINQIILILLLLIFVLFVIWMAFMVFSVGPGMRNM